jgi:hypothetical protein
MWSTVVAVHIEADLMGQSVDTQTMLEKRKKKWQPSCLLKHESPSILEYVRTSRKTYR